MRPNDLVIRLNRQRIELALDIQLVQPTDFLSVFEWHLHLLWDPRRDKARMHAVHAGETQCAVGFYRTSLAERMRRPHRSAIWSSASG